MPAAEPSAWPKLRRRAVRSVARRAVDPGHPACPERRGPGEEAPKTRVLLTQTMYPLWWSAIETGDERTVKFL